jgi:hypothetical protein
MGMVTPASNIVSAQVGVVSAVAREGGAGHLG